MPMQVNNEYDLSLPMAALLRIGTSRAHEDAENSQGGVRLVKGELDKEEYVYFLMMLWHIYE
jgi:heme oxygenase